MTLTGLLNGFVAFMLVVAGLLHVAVARAPEVCESPVTTSARRVMQAALAILAIFFVYQVLWRGFYQNPVLTLGLGLFALAEIAFCVAQLFPLATCEPHTQQQQQQHK